MLGIGELVLLVLLLAFVPFLLALIDVLRSEFAGNDKIVWLLAVVLVPLLGPLLYALIGRKQRVRR